MTNSKEKLIKGEDIIKLNELYLKEAFIKDFRQKWDKEIEIKNENLRTIHNPFHIGILQNFLDDETTIKHLAKEFNDVEWHRKQMDLYEFHQTLDLCNFDNEYLKVYYNYLKTTIMPWMAELTGQKLTHVSASCSMYNAGDHLLVHDDLLSDRKIAYILYLSPWEKHKTWDEQSGGALEILKADENNLPIFPVVEKIYPSNNQLLFFKVSDRSFHQVDEVTSMEYPRLSINGWFHGPVSDRNTDLPAISDEIKYEEPHDEVLSLSEWMNNIYLVDEIKVNLQKAVENNSEACLEEFLMPEMFDVMLEDFKTNTELQWSIKGPAHLRKYDILNVDKLRAGPVHDLYKLFTSREMFKLLYEYTELDLFGKNAKSPSCSIELQRWSKGCYTVLGDPSTYADSTLDIFLYFNAIENVGIITYLLPEEDDQQYKNAADVNDEDDPVLLTIYPKNNALNIVFRSEGTTKFMKYVSKNTVVDEHGYSYILVCSYRE